MLSYLLLSFVLSAPQIIQAPKGSCTSSQDCEPGLVCVGTYDNTSKGNVTVFGACGNTDPSNQEEYTVQLVMGARNAELKNNQTVSAQFTDSSAWQNPDSVPGKVVMAHLLAPAANDAYNNPPNDLGDMKALTGAIGGDTSQAIMSKWDWLSMTKVYGNTAAQKYVIAFKGTTNLPEALTDLTGLQIPCKFGTLNCGKIHFGFLQAYAALRAQVLKEVIALNLPPNAELYITGHSLGGALAIICAMDLANMGQNIRGMVAFGAPRVGDDQFETVYHNVLSSRKVISSRFAAINSEKSHQDGVTMLAPVNIVTLPYARPVNKIIAGVSPACEKWGLESFIPCEIRLHSMEKSYIPMIEALYPAASKKLQ